MNALAESPLPILVVGGLVSAAALIVFLARRDGMSLTAVAVTAVVTLALLLAERLIVAPREQVAAAIDGIVASIRGNDVKGVLAWVDPQARQIRADVQRLMPELKVTAANATRHDKVAVDMQGQPPTAHAQILATLIAVHERTAAPVAYVKQLVEMRWVQRDGRWLLADYTAHYDGRPIDAAASAAGNRPVARP
ncbi:MAG TPA: hypothetical protein PKC18_07265 [Lacipirellulaceae bacterium]|nr:hypothetical protein [Lacipirellulaceae bacterium]